MCPESCHLVLSYLPGRLITLPACLPARLPACPPTYLQYLLAYLPDTLLLAWLNELDRIGRSMQAIPHRTINSLLSYPSRSQPSIWLSSGPCAHPFPPAPSPIHSPHSLVRHTHLSRPVLSYPGLFSSHRTATYCTVAPSTSTLASSIAFIAFVFYRLLCVW